MSGVMSVRPDELRPGYQFLLGACGQASANTMPTPLCDDQCLRRLCKMAAAMPAHYYESLALHFFFLRGSAISPLKGSLGSSMKSTLAVPHQLGSHPAVLLSGLNKIIAGRLRARQSGVNCSDPQLEARPHLPGETIPKSASVSRMLTKSLEERFCEEALNDRANQHYVQYLTGTQTRLFEGVNLGHSSLAKPLPILPDPHTLRVPPGSRPQCHTPVNERPY
ncbi:hypothetical protein NQZ68_012108 [Dissostichus eleginoides]|nr:hypothetical protein NQZ68_012108 [Dissostichus eleginoides]